jgi:hypothetical protein
VLDDGVEQRTQILAVVGEVALGDAVARNGVDHGEIEQFFGGVEIDEEVEDLVQDLLRTGVGAVDLIDDDNRRQAGIEGFGEHVAGLRERAFAGVHQQHDAVDELQGALDLAAEVGVAGRVDDVDFHAVIVDAGGFGKDGDAALALELARVHDAFGDLLIGPEDAALAKHGVDEGGFAVVDVGNDGDVAKTVVDFAHG